jgi:5-hydroxyisourate hydrolase-like protein (transthyretin family)
VARDITIDLTPTGNVSGRLIADNGQPAVGVNLQLYKATYTLNGQRVLENAGSARSDDRGEYRFYWITPGRYYVAGGSAAATFTFGGGTSPNDPGDTYLLTYYPGVTDVNRATTVEVKSGSDIVADFVTPRQALYTISGKVVDPNSQATNGRTPAVALSLAFQMLTGNAGWFTMNQAYDAATGTFIMRNVLPGSYVLQAAAPPFFARVPVEVVNSNIEGLVVAVDSGVTINGRFVVEHGAMPPPNTLRLQMRPMTSNGLPNYLGAAPIPSPAAADGSFTISNVIQGQYKVIVPSQDFYVKELRYDRADALNSPIEVSRRSSDVATMEVIISRNVSQVDGLIVDDRGRPVSGVQAVLVPDNRGRTDLYKATTTDQDGRFVIRGVTPGDYKLFAWEALENYGYFDPDLLRRSESLGKPAHVAESSNLSVEGKIIPAAQFP